MANQYYYGREANKVLGPCSARRLKELAAAGEILPTDTVWKKGVKKGVRAKNLKNLFRSKPSDPPAPDVSVETNDPSTESPSESIAASEDPDPEEAVVHNVIPQSERTPQTTDRSETKPRQERKQTKRAIAVKGCVIVSQDGTYVRFKKKCTDCGQGDNCTSRMAIKNGLNVATFFCPKCRKVRQVEMRGSVAWH